MGRPKATLPVQEGSEVTFLQRLEKITRFVCNRRIVVSSLPEEELKVELPVVPQNHPERGQLSSLLLGWERLGKSLDWVLVCPVDHPYVSQATLQSLVRATEEVPSAWMWSPSYQKRGGHPAVFGRKLLERLWEAPPECGARPMVRTLGVRRHWVEVQDEAVLWNVDTPAEYSRYSTLFEKVVTHRG